MSKPALTTSTFLPRLKTPFHTKGLKAEHTAILQAYFVLHPLLHGTVPKDLRGSLTHMQDMQAVMMSLGQIIEHEIPNGRELFEIPPDKT